MASSQNMAGNDFNHNQGNRCSIPVSLIALSRMNKPYVFTLLYDTSKPVKSYYTNALGAYINHRFERNAAFDFATFVSLALSNSTLSANSGNRSILRHRTGS
jgi:hypothetical protein